MTFKCSDQNCYKVFTVHVWNLTVIQYYVKTETMPNHPSNWTCTSILIVDYYEIRSSQLM